MSIKKWVSCPSCRAFNDPAASVCSECSVPLGKKAQATAPRTEAASGASRFPPVCNALFILCLVLYAAELVVQVLVFNLPLISERTSFFGYIGAESRVHLLFGGPSPYVGAPTGFWGLITQNFLHGGALHIAMNLSVLPMLGSLCERYYGTLRMIVLVAVTCLSTGLSCLIANEPSIGLSGVLCGMLGAALFEARRDPSSPAYQQLKMWAISILVLSVVITEISLSGHFGGFVGGYLFAFLLARLPLHVVQDPRVVKTSAILALGLIIGSYIGLLHAHTRAWPYTKYWAFADILVATTRTANESVRTGTAPETSFYETVDHQLQALKPLPEEWLSIEAGLRQANRRLERRIREAGPRSLTQEDLTPFLAVSQEWALWLQAHPDPYGIRQFLATRYKSTP